MQEENEYLLKIEGRSYKYRRTNCVIRVSLIISAICCTALLISLIIVLLRIDDPTNVCKSFPNNKSQQNMYLHAAIASDSGPCPNIANNIMMIKGGNAVDGAIAGLICDCAVNFHSCGIGGGAFLVIYIKKDKKAYTIDLREQAPASAHMNMFVKQPKASLIGGKSIAVMGLISGYHEIHQKLGSLPWEALFEQTIDLLNTGFYVSKTIESAIDYFVKGQYQTEFGELWSVISDNITGQPKRFGDIIKIPKLSNTLRILAKEPHAMKNGSLVAAIIREIQNSGGNITKEDLNQYEVKWRTPIAVQLSGDQTLYTTPPPSSGTLIAFTLNVLAEYSFDSSYLDSCKKAGLFFHRFIETMKFAYAKRSALGDMDFVNVSNIMANLTSDKYAKWIKSLITDDRTHPVDYYFPSFEATEDHGTSHFSLISAAGDAVSSTSTINYLFGSLVMGNETGVLYNDEMDDFSTPNKSNIYNVPPSPSNFIEPRKRPMSSMSPVIIVDNAGNVNLVTGASGGSRIISATSLVSTLSNLLKREIKESIDHPRVHHQLLPDIVMIEENFPKGIADELKKRGHKLGPEVDHAVVQGVHRSNSDTAYWECNADFRKLGRCDGY